MVILGVFTQITLFVEKLTFSNIYFVKEENSMNRNRESHPEFDIWGMESSKLINLSTDMC
jgi:hypothetical protein